MATGPIVMLVLALGVLLYILSIYNGLVRMRNLVRNAFAQIDVQLKRRYDLIPNLVETAKTYLKHEAATLEAVVQARNSAAECAAKVGGRATLPGAMKELIGAEGVLAQSMSRLMAVVEAYPDLKANATMARMMEELTSTENKIGFSRQAYNDAVMIYNNDREVFPNSWVAGPGGFLPAELWQITNAPERENVKVAFS